MEQNEEIEIQLWEYIDGGGNDSDRHRIAKLIEWNPIWKEKYRELSAFNATLSNEMEMEQPSMRFTQNVMDAVAAAHISPATGKYINKGIIRGIAAFFIIMIATILGYAFANTHYDTNTPSLFANLNLSKLNLGKYLNSTTMNIIIAVNVVVGLVLIDTILRRKRTQHT